MKPLHTLALVLAAMPEPPRTMELSGNRSPWERRCRAAGRFTKRRHRPDRQTQRREKQARKITRSNAK